MRVKGMAMCNPVMIDRDYILKCAEYAIENGYRHFEIVGPTHDPIRGNCDGMIFYRKYSEFNSDKDGEYVEHCERVVNEVCDMLVPHGIKVYYWHHELEVPYRFDEVYPEIHNSDGDVEVTHPLIKDFLVNKIEDFFHTYPKMSGIVLTLHETRIPLLKLKNQKLDKIERVKYVTEILYETCKRLGKELIVRPFASMASDYDDLMTAYERISRDNLVVCDKWTQFDWSLTMPNNVFLDRIKNPLMIETDIFGEYFGKGHLPIMLKDHITRKYAECEEKNPLGYVSRIDRGGFVPFGTPNEVNLEIMSACHDGRDVDEAIDAFFCREYGECADEVKALMSDTEDIQIMMFYVDRVEYSMLSVFPGLSYIKSAQKVEMLRDDAELDRGKWYIPAGWERSPIENVLGEKRRAVELAEAKLERLYALEGRLTAEKYNGLYTRFVNLYIVAKLWEQLTMSTLGLAKYFETKDEKYADDVRAALEKLREIEKEGYRLLGDAYYCEQLKSRGSTVSNVERYCVDTERAFEMELAETKRLEAKGLVDYVIAGGFSERHSMKYEINFSSAHTMDDGICRLAGSSRGKTWSVLKAHGWFSYEIKVKPNARNIITVSAKGSEGHLDYEVSIGDMTERVSMIADGRREVEFVYDEKAGKKSVLIRFDRTTEFMPYVYTVEVR